MPDWLADHSDYDGDGAFIVYTDVGPLVLEPGDWAVHTHDGGFATVPHAVFIRLFSASREEDDE